MAFESSSRVSSPSSVLYGVIEALDAASFFSRVLQGNYKSGFWPVYTRIAAIRCSEIDFVAGGSSPTSSSAKIALPPFIQPPTWAQHTQS